MSSSDSGMFSQRAPHSGGLWSRLAMLANPLEHPMIGKELRQRMRERRGWLLPSIYLVVLSGVVLAVYYFVTRQVKVVQQGADVGVPLFLTLHLTQFTLMLLLAPVFSAGTITIEKEQATMVGLVTSLLSPLDIWWGKFISSLLFQLLLLFATLPVLSLVFALGGVGMEQVLAAAADTAIMLVAVNCIGLYFSSVFRRSISAIAMTYVVVIGLCVLSVVVFALAYSWWAMAHRAPAGMAATVQPEPWYVLSPMYFNPYLLAWGGMSQGAREGGEEIARHWQRALGVFAGISGVCSVLAVRNIARFTHKN